MTASDMFSITASGTGSQLTKATIIVAGVASLVATVLSFLSIWLQTKNYRKPLLQRYVVRILLMVPIYSATSWASILSTTAAFWLDPIRDIYEAFTIYTFFQLLINFIGGERALVIMMNGRQPVHHPWPLQHALAKVDISDPHTFLAIKRGILQYTWLKPVLSVATIILKATDTYQEGYLGVKSGYLWIGILYNVSVTLSLYSLAMFWVCMHEDLQPFRPVPKFLCIKLIIFASYWQGFFLSILQFLGAIPSNVPGYSADSLAAAIQDALICLEMPLFAMAHWYAFSWHDYADATISAARMPVKYAMRDAFGPLDLIQDTKETFGGTNYEYRLFDSGDNVLAHEESAARVNRMMEGMRYERGGKGKYWIPKPGEINSRTPLLQSTGAAGPSRTKALGRSKTGGKLDEYRASSNVEDAALDSDDEALFAKARELEFGDWNYPVITAHTASRERWLHSDPNLLTTSTNRNLLQPTAGNKKHRKDSIQKKLGKGKHRQSSSHNKSNDRKANMAPEVVRKESSSNVSNKSGRSQLVDLVVEDVEAEETERVRARKEGGAEWNTQEQKHFVRTYGNDDMEEGEDIREGFEPSQVASGSQSEFAIGDDEDEGEEEGHQPNYGAAADDRNVWD